MVGTLPTGQVVGFTREADGCRLAVGSDPAAMAVDPLPILAQRRALIALAMAHFEDQLDEPPTAEGPTHQDLAELVRWLAGTAADPDWSRCAGLALDAIEDGLPGDAVALSLAALAELEMERAAPAVSAPLVDPVEQLLARASALEVD